MTIRLDSVKLSKSRSVSDQLVRHVVHGHEFASKRTGSNSKHLRPLYSAIPELVDQAMLQSPQRG